MGEVPDAGCKTFVTINFCKVQAGDILLERSTAPKGQLETFFGDTYWTHAVLVAGFWELGSLANARVVPVLLDITPNPDNRTEMALSDAENLHWDPRAEAPDGAAVYRSVSMTRAEREEVGRRGLAVALGLGAGQVVNQYPDHWNANGGDYAYLPDGWGPDRYYCSSLVATAYGMTFADFKSSQPILGTAALFVTPDDLLEHRQDLGKIMWFGVDGRSFSLWSPANVLLTNRSGQRAGRSADGAILEEIPGALWRLNDDNESISAPDVGDEWTLTVSGTGEGDYHLLAHGVGAYASARTVTARSIRPGQVETFRVGDLFGSGAAPVASAGGAAGLTALPIVAAAGALSLLLVAAVMVVRRRPGGRVPLG
jgi:hypothetical protein